MPAESRAVSSCPGRPIKHLIEVGITRIRERKLRGGQDRTVFSTAEIVAEVSSIAPGLKRWQIVRSLRMMDNRRDYLPFVYEHGVQGCKANLWHVDERLPKMIRLAYADELEPLESAEPSNTP